jgi:beta-lactam-binding protein with PASTA domain
VAGPADDGDLVVPDLTGKTREEAEAIVKQAGFTEGVESSRPGECGDEAPKDAGKIDCQIPEPGAHKKHYTIIEINVYEPQHLANMIVRSQLAQLIGKTPEEARRLLKSFGHVGRLAIEASKTYYEHCHPGRICDFNVAPAGAGVEDDMILYTQKELPSTTAPPP